MNVPIDTATDLLQRAAALEADIAKASIAAGRGPEGLALNVAKTLVLQARGVLILAATEGAAVGSG